MTLERYAALSARMAEDPEAAEATLRREGLSLRDWQSAREFFSAAFAREALGPSEPLLAERYAELLVREQSAAAQLRELTPEAWAALAFAASVGELDAALEAEGLRQADYLRQARHWAERLGREPALARRYAEEFYRRAKARQGEANAG
jgi:hypothetical protein